MLTPYSYVSNSCSSIWRILTEHLETCKVYEWWVSQNLTPENLKLHMRTSLKFLTHYATEDEDFLQRIITGDESWVHYWTPNTKKASMMWKTAEEPTPLKFKEHPSTRKIMGTGFWDQYGLLLLDFYPQKISVTSASYFYTLVKLKMVTKENNCGLLSRGVILHNDNMSSHAVGLTQTPVKNMKWENLEAFIVFPGSCSIGFLRLLVVER